MSDEDASVVVRPLQERDWEAWRSLWDAYNAFYGRIGTTALPAAVTHATWDGLTTPAGAFHGLVAEEGKLLIGLTHYLFHASTTDPAGLCYLQDLIVSESARRRGVGGRLIKGVKRAAMEAGVSRIYWQTRETNVEAISLYEKVGRRTGFIVFAA